MGILATLASPLGIECGKWSSTRYRMATDPGSAHRRWAKMHGLRLFDVRLFAYSSVGSPGLRVRARSSAASNVCQRFQTQNSAPIA